MCLAWKWWDVIIHLLLLKRYSKYKVWTCVANVQATLEEQILAEIITGDLKCYVGTSGFLLYLTYFKYENFQKFDFCVHMLVLEFTELLV